MTSSSERCTGRLLCKVLLCTVLLGSAWSLDNGLALTPVMGWNTWDHFRCSGGGKGEGLGTPCNAAMDNCVSEVLIRETADAIVERGLAERGYEYVNLDDCWMAKARDANGKLQPDQVRFPSGMANLSAYVHSKGLKLGIYEASGGGTCCGFPGTDGPTHAVADVDQFSAWNIDMLKWDGCGPGAGGDYNKSYTAMYEALTRPHIRPMVYSCSWPAYINIPGTCWGHPEGCDFNNVPGGYEYLAKICNMWRLYSDITDEYSSGVGNPMGFADIARYWALKQDELAPWNGPGHWNDPDMLEIGNQGLWGAKENLTTPERRSHMALWCIFAAPLILGGDVRTLSAGDLAIVTNAHLIRINQDKRGTQGRCIRGCPKAAAAQPWAAASFANFTAAKGTKTKQVFALSEPHGPLSGVRLAAFSQYSKWQPLIVEVQFQTSAGVWLTNSGCAKRVEELAGFSHRAPGEVVGNTVHVQSASGFVDVDGVGNGTPCDAADGNLSTYWNAKSESSTGRYWIDFAFGTNQTLKAVSVASSGDGDHDLKDFGLLPNGPGASAPKLTEPVQLWTKPLSDGSIAVVLFNPADATQQANFTMREVGLKCATANVLSVWAEGATSKQSHVTVRIETHDSAGFICSCV